MNDTASDHRGAGDADADAPIIETGSVPTLIHGHHLVWRGADAPAQGGPLLVAFHGYGETARHLLDVLRQLPDARHWTICAIEGLHRLYTRSGRIVGSWMTSAGRDAMIADNIRYVGATIAAVRTQLGGAARPMVFAGFSQGVAMTYRAAAFAGHRPDGLIALAGDVPPDVVAGLDGAPAPRLPPVLLGRGEEDGWYTAAKMNADLDALGKLGVAVETHVFPEGHVWAPSFCAAASDYLAAARSRTEAAAVHADAISPDSDASA
ncbi:MAG: hypothetical protein AAF772_05120 [Acidobacteriota bacterium]